MESKPSLAYPKVKKELAAKGKVHAEQLLMLKIKKFYQAKNIKHFKVTIGLNQLSCQTCELVLNQEADKFSYRSGSGIQYLNVINTTTEEVSKNFYMSDCGLFQRERVTPDDSDSEPESVGTSHSKSKYSSASFFKLSSEEEVHQKNRNKHINQRTISVKS